MSTACCMENVTKNLCVVPAVIPPVHLVESESKRGNDLKTNESRQQTLTNTMDFGLYFQPFFDLCYYICMIPFKIENNGKSYFISTNFIQRILCGIVHTLITFVGLFEIQHICVQNIQRAYPDFFLHLLYMVNGASYCFVLAYSVWFNKDAILAVFGEPGANPSPYVQKRGYYVGIGLVVSAIAFTIYDYVSWFLMYDVQSFQIKKSFWNYSRVQERLSNNIFGETSRPNEPYQPTIGLQIIGLAYFLSRIYFRILINLMFCLNNISAFIGYSLAKKFNALLVHSSAHSYEDELKVFNMYYKIKKVIENLNEIVGPVLVLEVLSLIFYCGVSVVDILESKSLTYPFKIIGYFCSASLMLLISAEVHYKMSQIKGWILAPEKKSCSTVAKYLEIENCNLAFKGGRFFNITYGFIGAAASVVLTYAIIMIQLKPATNSSV